MQSFEHAYQFAADLYWIAFLLTACSDRSVDVVMKVLDKNTACLLSPLTELRRTVISEALTSIRDEVALSESRMKDERIDEVTLPSSGWSLDPHTTKAQVERALLAIDTFPRCALLLTVFEGLKIADASALLHAGSESITNGVAAGLYELTGKLASLQECHHRLCLAVQREVVPPAGIDNPLK